MTNNIIDATVTGVTWERTIMTLCIRVEFSSENKKTIKLEFFAMHNGKKMRFQFKIIGEDNNVYTISLNFTNPGNGLCLPSGTYSIMICYGEQTYLCEIAPTCISCYADWSRVFLYGGRKKSYTISFLIPESEEGLPFIFHVLGYNYEQKHKSNRIKLSVWLRNWKEKQFRPVVKFIYNFLFNLYALLNKRKNTVMFLSEQSNTLGDNLVAVRDRMIERQLNNEYKILESARLASSEKQSFKSWLIFINKVASSEFIFVDDHVPAFDWIILKENTHLFQLWHAGVGFKASGYSRWGHDGCPAPFSAHRQYEYGIAGSRAIAPIYAEAWGINLNQVLPTGIPRMDRFLDQEYSEKKKEELYETYPDCRQKKVILFAPTYRGKNRATAYYPYEKIDFDKLYQLCADDKIVFFKMHPWVNSTVPIPPEYGDKFFDLSEYGNINDLFYITDLLITDYSSSIYEYALMNRPMLFYAFDEVKYSLTRGFHGEYKNMAPGRICHTFVELIEAIKEEDFEYEKVEQFVMRNFDHIDTHSSDRVIDWMLLGDSSIK